MLAMPRSRPVGLSPRVPYLFAALVACGLLAVAGCNKNDLSTPKSAAKSFAKAVESGDADAAKASSTGGDPQTIDALAKAGPHLKKMREAMVSKFGDKAKTALGGHEGAATDMAAQVDESTEQITGDTATLTPKGGGKGMKLKKVGADWKIDAGEMAPAGLGNKAATMFDSMAKAADETTEDVNAGKFKTAEEAGGAFIQKMMAGAFGAVGK